MAAAKAAAGTDELIASLGAASGYLSVMVLARYIQDAMTAVMYRYPHSSGVPAAVLGEPHLDAGPAGRHARSPIIFAAKDRISLVSAGLNLLVFWLAV